MARFEIDHGPLRERIEEMGKSAAEVARETGVSLPKILGLLRLVGNRGRVRPLSGPELVILCCYTDTPLSAVVKIWD